MFVPSSLSSPSELDSDHIHVRHFDNVLKLCSFIFSIFFFPDCIISSDVASNSLTLCLFVVYLLPLSLSSAFISDIVYSNSRISIWFFLYFSVSQVRFLIFLLLTSIVLFT